MLIAISWSLPVSKRRWSRFAYYSGQSVQVFSTVRIAVTNGCGSVTERTRSIFLMSAGIALGNGLLNGKRYVPWLSPRWERSFRFQVVNGRSLVVLRADLIGGDFIVQRPVTVGHGSRSD